MEVHISATQLGGSAHNEKDIETTSNSFQNVASTYAYEQA